MPIQIERLEWSDPDLARLPMPRGEMRLTRSLTSGLTIAADDPPGTFWGVGDRGPNIKPRDSARRYGLDDLGRFAGLDGAKVMPLPDQGPALARFRLTGRTVRLEAVERLHGDKGTPLPGLPPPAGPHGESEPALALDGALLGCHPDGADTEGIAALPGGRFWIGEEYGPSLLLTERTGRVIRRLVPQGCAEWFAGSSVPVEPVLPALAASRKLNRGIESLALSPCGKQLHVMFQSPLAHPDRAAHDASDLVRLWTLDAETGVLLHEYAYPLDPPESFRRDAAAGPVARADVKVSEMTVLPDGGLLVLERITLSTKLYRVDLDAARALPPAVAAAGQRPTLEQLGAAAAAARGLPVLEKHLLLSTDDHPRICGDLEGMIVIGPDQLLLANDSDYGTEGATTQFWRVTFPAGTFGSSA